MDYQLAEELTGPHPEIAVFRSSASHQQKYNGTSSEEGVSSHFQVRGGVRVILPPSVSMPQASGGTNRQDPDGQVGSLQMRAFQIGFLRRWMRRSIHQRKRLTPAMKQSFMWWREPSNLNCCQLVVDPPLVVTANASAFVWGAQWNGLLAQGQWGHS